MQFSHFHELDPWQVEVIDERSNRSTGSRRPGKGRYPRQKFDYANYDVDPRPDVLVLGSYDHPNTGNDLLAGVNLHYLSRAQLADLQKNLKKIFSRDTLRSRYRALKSLVPEVAQYYRTYDTEYIAQVEPDELQDYDPKKRRLQAMLKPDKDDEKQREKAEIHAVQHKPEVPEPSDEKDTDDDIQRRVFQAKRSLVDPDTKRRTKPERDDDEDTRHQKNLRYRQQRRMLKKLERQAALDRLAHSLEREPDELEPEPDDLAITKKPPQQSELGDVYESIGAYYSPEIGVVWPDEESYITWHSMPNFKRLPVSEGKVCMAHNVRTGQTLVDVVDDPAYILGEAGWGYSETILIRPDGDDLRVIYDGLDDVSAIVEGILGSPEGTVLLEST